MHTDYDGHLLVIDIPVEISEADDLETHMDGLMTWPHCDLILWGIYAYHQHS